MKSIKEQKHEGKEYRKTVSRKDLGKWEVQTNREVVEQLIKEQESTRLPQLIPLRHERMSVSPFTFFRGSAILQAHDQGIMPHTGFYAMSCGDAHISNFGIFASPERRIVFDINDFDETLPAPFECDIKRLVASVEICGRQRGFTQAQREESVYQAAHFYREAMLSFSEMGTLDVWYKHIDVESAMEEYSYLASKREMDIIKNVIEKATKKNSSKAIKKYTEMFNGQLRIKSDPPIILPLRDLVGEEKAIYGFKHNVDKTLSVYKHSLPVERRGILDQYEPLEMAHKVVGVGSVGTQAWILVMQGREDGGDPLVLQIKQAGPSVLEKWFGAGKHSEYGRRVVEGQRIIQTAGDILLGWLRMTLPNGQPLDYYVRQLWDSKGSFDLDVIQPNGLYGLSSMCAWTLAHAHAKSGSRHAIAGYLGKSTAFEEAMVKYASAYADQNEADYETFLNMISK